MRTLALGFKSVQLVGYMFGVSSLCRLADNQSFVTTALGANQTHIHRLSSASQDSPASIIQPISKTTMEAEVRCAQHGGGGQTD